MKISCREQKVVILRKRVSVFIQAIRPFAFSASVIPIILGGVFAASRGEKVMWPFFPLVLLSGLFVHSGTNVVSEYFDFKKGVDRKDTFGSSRVLVDGLMEPVVLLKAGVGFFVLALLLACPLFYARGVPLLVIALVGVLGGFFYSATPIGYKYRGLGDLWVFVLMGPLMVAGSYIALTGGYTHGAVFVSLPVGFLVTAILLSNNIRDIAYDKRAGVLTLEGFIGYRNAKIVYFLLVMSAYASVIVLVLSKILALWILIVFFSIPLVVRNTAIIARGREDVPGSLATIDVLTAQLHLVFGGLFIIGILLGMILER